MRGLWQCEVKTLTSFFNFTQRLLLSPPGKTGSSKRSKIMTELLEEQLAKCEEELHQCAAEVEKDEALNKEMDEWETSVGDGMEPES